MNIGAYTFEEFRDLAANFHGYAAPGVLIGGYMVEKAKAALPPDTLFEAVVESAKCLPDAVQLLTACSTGNQRMKVVNLGKYALALFDKYSGDGVRVCLDSEKMKAWPELYSWFFKLKPKKEQDSKRLEAEIRDAGDSLCLVTPARVKKRFIGGKHMAGAAVCPLCGEGYPAEDGPICRGCRGESPYEKVEAPIFIPDAPIKIVPAEEAAGKIAAHDMTRIEPGAFKGPEFRAGQRITAGDVCRLQQMGRFNVAVLADGETGAVHENEAAEAFAKKMAGRGVSWNTPPKEGKIDFLAAEDGLLCVNEEALTRFNLAPMVMAAARRDATLVKKGAKIGGTRAIPLYLTRENFNTALNAVGDQPIFEILPLRKARVGVLVTGTEIFKGLVEDKFIPIITAKILDLGGEVVASIIVPDDRKSIRDAAQTLIDKGVDLLITTGGLSVDPDDVTRLALLETGLADVVHGVPVLPGAMSLIGKIYGEKGEIQVLGVPACALYFKTTFLDLILPRLLAGRDFTRLEAAKMGAGGYCLSCKTCSWPKCSFGK